MLRRSDERKVLVDRLRLYKTAYAPSYSSYVEVVGVFPDSEIGDPVIIARMAHTNDVVLFRHSELQDFCF